MLYIPKNDTCSDVVRCSRFQLVVWLVSPSSPKTVAGTAGYRDQARLRWLCILADHSSTLSHGWPWGHGQHPQRSPVALDLDAIYVQFKNANATGIIKKSDFAEVQWTPPTTRIWILTARVKSCTAEATRWSTPTFHCRNSTKHSIANSNKDIATSNKGIATSS